MEMRTGLSGLGLVIILAVAELVTRIFAASSNATVSVADSQVPTNTTDMGETGSTGMIAGIIIGAVIVLILVAFLVYLVLKNKKLAIRRGKYENDREIQVQMASARNAGVYLDLTTTEQVPKEIAETERLKKGEEEEL